MQRARQTPDAVALIDGERTVSCAELDRSSAALAARLAALGVTTETPVAICLPRSVELAVSILAVLRAGGAFLLLDPQAPAERQSFMLQDSAALVLIANDAPSWLPSEAPPALVIAGQPLPDAPAPRIDGDPQQLAYICYTSGSSGPPKAVMGLHRGAVNRVRWMAERYPFEPSDVCCLKTTPTFVDFVWEFFGPLLAGVPSVIVPPADVLDPAAFARTLERHRVTRVVLVPSLLRSLLNHVGGIDRELRALRRCTTSGEALPVALARRCLALLPDCRLLNLYGSSETSADASFHDVTAADAHPVPIGRPTPG
ncbi:amino acid adenylation domain-containing protein, partial [Paraburkholderia sp. Se-20369]|nr:amino acid adenylation domain-containing protein [Paraburkholderia sp. Se-20369]